MATAAPSPLASSVEKTNGAKLSRLLIDGGTTVLRKLFDHYHPPAHLVTSLNTHSKTLNDLFEDGHLYGPQWYQLFPTDRGAPDSKNFDISLLFLLLTNICDKLSPPRGGWYKKPQPQDHTTAANLARIRVFRNELYGHVTSTSIDTPTFNALWRQISGALRGLGLDKAEIDRLKAEHCGEEDYIGALCAWSVSEQDIKSQLEDICQSQTKIQQSVDKLHRSIVQDSKKKSEEEHPVQTKTQQTVDEVRQSQTKTQQTVDEVRQSQTKTQQSVDEVRQSQTKTQQTIDEIHQSQTKTQQTVDEVRQSQTKTQQSVDEVRQSQAKTQQTIDEIRQSQTKTQQTVDEVRQSQAKTQQTVDEVCQSQTKTQQTVDEVRQSQTKTQQTVDEVHQSQAKTQQSVDEVRQSQAKTQQTVDDIRQSQTKTQQTVDEVRQSQAKTQQTVDEVCQSQTKTQQTVDEVRQSQTKTQQTVDEVHQSQAKTQQTVDEVRQSQTKTQQTVDEVRQSQAKTQQTVDEVRQSQAKTQQTVDEVHQSQTKTQQTVDEVRQSQAKTQQTVGEVHKSQTKTQQTVDEVHQSQTKTQQTVDEVRQSQTKTQQTVDEVRQSQAKTQQTVDEVHQSQAKTQQTVDEVRQSQAKTQQTVDEVRQSQAKTQQTVDEVRQSQAKTQQTVDEVRQSQAKTQQTVDEVRQSQAKTQQTVDEVRQSQTKTQQTVDEVRQSQAKTQQTVDEVHQSQTKTQQTVDEVRQSQTKTQQTVDEVRQSQTKTQQTVDEVRRSQTKTQQTVDEVRQNQLEDRGTIQDSNTKLQEVFQMDRKTHQAVRNVHETQMDDSKTIREIRHTQQEFHKTLQKTNSRVEEIQQSHEKLLGTQNERFECLRQDLKQTVENLEGQKENDRENEVLKKLAKIDTLKIVRQHRDRYVEGTRLSIFAKVESWLNDKSSPNRVMVISGNAGMGKSVISAVMCEKMQEAGRLAGSHFCQHDRARHRNPKVMLQSLASQLGDFLPDYQKALVEKLSRNLGVEINNMEVKDLFEVLFEEPLTSLKDPGLTYLMVIDGLDESEFQGRNKLLDVIANYFQGLPLWIRFLVTTRPEINITKNLKNLHPLQLDPNVKENVKDIYLYFEKQISHLLQSEHPENILEALVQKSEGVMLYAHYLVDFIEIEVPLVTPDLLDSILPSGISSVYHSYFKRLETELCKELRVTEDQYLTFLSAIAASREPLPLSFVSKLLLVPGKSTSVAQRKVNAAISCVSALLPVQDECIHFFHKSVKDWLVDKCNYEQHDFIVDEKDGHNVLSKLCIDELDDVKRKGVDCSQLSDTTRYALRHGVQHMLQLEDAKVCSLEEVVKKFVLDIELVFAKLCVNVTVAFEDIVCVQKQVGIKELQRALNALLALLRKHIATLENVPHAIFQTLLNEGGPELSSQALNLLETKYFELAYMEYLHKDDLQGSVQTKFQCSAAVACFDVSPQLDYMVCECFDNTIQLWSLNTGKQLWRRDVKVTKDNYFNSGYCDDPLYEPYRGWENYYFYLDYDEEWPHRPKSLYRSVVFHPTEDLVLPGILSHAYTFDGDLKPLFLSSKCCFCICSISADKTKMLSDCTDDVKSVVMWSLADGSEMNRLSWDVDIVSFAWCRDGRLLAISDLSGTIGLLDVMDGYRTQVTISVVCGVIKFSPDSRCLYCLDFNSAWCDLYPLEVVKNEGNFSLDILRDEVSYQPWEFESCTESGFLLGDPFCYTPEIDTIYDPQGLSLAFVLNNHSVLRVAYHSSTIEMLQLDKLKKDSAEFSETTGLSGRVQTKFQCSAAVACFDVSPQLDYMVCECYDNTIQLWSLHTGKQLWRRDVKVTKDNYFKCDGDDPLPPKSLYRSVVFHPTEDLVLPGILSHAYTFDGELKPLFHSSKCCFCICSISADKTKMLTDCTDDAEAIIMWSLTDGSEMNRFSWDADIVSFAWSRDGGLLAISDLSRRIGVVDVMDGFNPLSEILMLPEVCGMIKFSPDSRCLYCLVFNSASCNLFRLYVNENYGDFCVGTCTFSSEESYQPWEFELFSEGGFLLGDPFCFSPERYTIQDPQRLSLAFLLNNHSVLIVAYDSSIIDMLQLDPELTKVFEATVRKVALSLNGEMLFVITTAGGSAAALMAWDISSRMFRPGKIVFEDTDDFDEHNLVAVREGVLLQTSRDTLELWNFELSKCIRSWTDLKYIKKVIPISEEQVACEVLFLVEGELERKVMIVDTTREGVVSTIAVHGHVVACNSKCHVIITDRPELQMQCGDVVRWKISGLFGRFFRPLCEAVSPTQQYCVLANYEALHVFDVVLGKRLRTVKPSNRRSWGPFQCKFVSDEEYVFYLSDELNGHLLKLFNVKSGDLLSEIALESRVCSLTACPRERLIAISFWSNVKFKVLQVKLPGDKHSTRSKR